MTDSKQERLVNLVICLLETRRFLTRDQIKAAVEGYQKIEKVSAFEKMFERDKDEIRALGIRIETGYNDVLCEDDLGYRIVRIDAELPQLDLDPAEATAVALACEMWRETRGSSAAKAALAKLRESGAAPDTTLVSELAPMLSSSGPRTSGADIDIVRRGLVERREVQFVYHGEKRRLQPWRVRLHRGAWYVDGYDLVREDVRQFKLARFETDAKLVGRAFAFTTPDALPEQEPTELRVAHVAIAHDQAWEIKRLGHVVAEAAPFAHMDVYEVAYIDEKSLAVAICSVAPHAIALSPASLRQACVAHLQGVLHGDV